MVPRFSFFDPQPPPTSVADKIFSNTEKLEITLYRREDGNVTAAIELRSTIGADLFADDDDDGDLMEQSRKSGEALALCRQLLCGFAAAGKDGAA